jgi:hypothetical protein
MVVWLCPTVLAFLEVNEEHDKSSNLLETDVKCDWNFLFHQFDILRKSVSPNEDRQLVFSSKQIS